MTINPRVLMVTGEYPPRPGGVGDYTALLSAELARQGASILVLTDTSPGKGWQTPDSANPRVLRTVENWGYGSWSRVASAAAAHSCQIVHLQYQAAAFQMHPAVNLLPAFLRVRMPALRVVTTFHDLRVPYLFPKAGPLRQRAVRALDSFSHATITTNHADLEELGGAGSTQSGNRPRRWLIPLGSNISKSPPADFDRDAWRAQLGASGDTLLISYFGFMNDTKGVEYLVQAVGLLVGRGVNVRLLVVGGETGETDPTNRGYSQRVDQLIKSRHLENRVFWTGFLPPDQVSASLLSSDLCALPFRDGVSLRRGSLLAAIVHGLPVVTTFPERPEPALVDGGNVAMVDRDSPSALADTLEGLWQDREGRQRLADGAERLASTVGWAEIATRHIELYRNLL